MILADLLEKTDYTLVQGRTDITVKGLVYDSRKVCPGDVFVCIKGAVSDGHKFIPDVVKKGAAAVVVEKDYMEKEDLPADVTVIMTEDTRLALANMSAAYFGYPAQRVTTIGITGTKGKTTATYMVKAILDSIGLKTGLIGTIETIIGDEVIAADNTTPESYVIQETFARMADKGCRCVVMEVSSQGLKQHRVGGFIFDYGIFTNIEPDHIGTNEHKDFDEYLFCKSMLMRQCRTGIVNADDAHVQRILEGHTCRVECYGIKQQAPLMAENIRFYKEKGILGMKFDVTDRVKHSRMSVSVDIPGEFSVYNALCAIAVCRHFTGDDGIIKDALSGIRVKGRAEIIPVSERFTLMIDYAHNAMSLESLLKSLRVYEPGRLVAVFGCGGNRDRNRRFEMGEVSSRLADLTIVTSDNPRDEDPMAIINDILTGIHKGSGEYVTIPDRTEAIRYAIKTARDGDIIVLAGKGHEDYQIIKGVKYPMDERNIISDIIQEEDIKTLL